MNSTDRLELDLILRDQRSVHRLVAQLDHRINAISQSLATPPPTPAPLPVGPPALPAAPPISITVATAPIPRPASPPIPPAPTAPPRPTPQTDSIEMKLGTYWLARLGIVILLTGFVFLGNYAYHHIVPLLGAWGKLALLALGGITLGGTGAWLERSRESMRNYARVLLAGGAATFYYTAYAAHFVAALRVIESPLLGGALLLLLAGGFLWFAERRRSEPLALSAVLLSYYTAAINPIGSLSLFSNLLLTAVAVAFLLRHRWAAISFASLTATYASFGFWRFHALAVTGQSGSGEFGTALGFLGGYWLLFTAAVFLSHREALRPVQRTAFLTANNGALFAYAAQHFGTHRPGDFWLFAISYGIVLLALAAVATRRRPEDRGMDGAYLAQGLAMLALGCTAKLSGPQLATVFAVESAVLLTLSRTRHRWLYELAAGLAAVAAFALALDAIIHHPAHVLPLGGSVALILLADAWWLKRIRNEFPSATFCGRAFGLAALGLVLTGVVLWKIVPQPWQPATFAGAALLCALTPRPVRMPEIALPGQMFLFVATGLFLVRHLTDAMTSAWIPLPLVVMAVALTHFWQHQRALHLPVEAAAGLQFACAAAATATGLGWLHAIRPDANGWLVAPALAACGTLFYGAITRSWAVALLGQIFAVVSIFAFAHGLLFHTASSQAALAPIANLAVTALCLGRLPAHRFPVGDVLPHLVRICRIVANLLLVGWALAFVERPWLTPFCAVLAAAHILGGALLRDRDRSITGLTFAIGALALFWLRLGTDTLPDLAALLVIPVSLRCGRYFTGADLLPPKVRNTLVAAVLASVWLWVTRAAIGHGYASSLTTAWALLALVVFPAGLALRERIYRVGGFAILALATARIFVIDVWQLETIYRILSFLVLGAVLLVLGYLYNRFAESIRRWL